MKQLLLLLFLAALFALPEQCLAQRGLAVPFDVSEEGNLFCTRDPGGFISRVLTDCEESCDEQIDDFKSFITTTFPNLRILAVDMTIDEGDVSDDLDPAPGAWEFDISYRKKGIIAVVGNQKDLDDLKLLLFLIRNIRL